MGLSAVCAYNLSTAEAVFSRGKYMQSATVEQSHTKWVRYNGAVPTPRPGAVSEGRGCGTYHAGPLCHTGRVSVSQAVGPPLGLEGQQALCPPPVFLMLGCCVTAAAA